MAETYEYVKKLIESANQLEQVCASLSLSLSFCVSLPLSLFLSRSQLLTHSLTFSCSYSLTHLSYSGSGQNARRCTQRRFATILGIRQTHCRERFTTTQTHMHLHAHPHTICTKATPLSHALSTLAKSMVDQAEQALRAETDPVKRQVRVT